MEARATQLLQSLEPLEESAHARRRVWLALSKQPRRITGARLLARPALAAVLVVFLSAAVAGASVGRGWLARVAATLGAVSEPVSAPAESRTATRSRERAPRRLAPPLEATAELASPAEASEAPATRETSRAPARAARNATASPRVDASKRSSFGAEAFAAAPREEASLVLGAMTALRREHDAARSAQLLATYLRRYPRGVLREEALALQIEAASSLHDPKLGARFARGYLLSHPNGRFRELAKNALDRPPSPAEPNELRK